MRPASSAATCVSRFSDRGTRVRGLDAFTTFYDPERKRANTEAVLRDPRFELVSDDLLTARLDEVLDGVDLVAHLAGEPGVSNSWGPNFDRATSTGTCWPPSGCSRRPTHHGVDRLVYASSSSVYGTGADTLRAAGEPRPASPYGVTKLAAETLVGAYAGTGLPAVSLRYFSVYGPRQRPDMAAHRFIESPPRRPSADGLRRRPAGARLHLRRRHRRGDRAGALRRRPDRCRARRGQQPADVGQHPRQPPGGLWSASSPRATRTTSVPATSRAPRARSTSARDQLGWKPTIDLRTGLKRQLDWHRSLRADGVAMTSDSPRTADLLPGRPGTRPPAPHHPARGGVPGRPPRRERPHDQRLADRPVLLRGAGPRLRQASVDPQGEPGQLVPRCGCR